MAGTTEASFVEVGQFITGMKYSSFLTPDMASKNDARHDIDLFSAEITRCHVSMFFDTMSGVKKLATFIPAINCPISAFEPSFKFAALSLVDTTVASFCQICMHSFRMKIS